MSVNCMPFTLTITAEVIMKNDVGRNIKININLESNWFW
jgi:hypothetical protein